MLMRMRRRPPKRKEKKGIAEHSGQRMLLKREEAGRQETPPKERAQSPARLIQSSSEGADEPSADHHVGSSPNDLQCLEQYLCAVLTSS